MIFLRGISSFYPIMLAFGLLIASAIPIYISGASSFFPAIDIMVVFYWSIRKPSSVPNWFIFTLGILRDVIEGITLGVSPCIYLITKLIVISSRDLYRKANFIVIWQGFAIVTLLTIIAKWLLISFIMGEPIPPNNAIMQFMLSIALYPLIHWVFNLVDSTMPEKFNDE